jgi:uncharacterized protein (TIGR03032 family)
MLPPLDPEHITCSPGFAGWLAAQQASLAFTSYQSGSLYLVGIDEAQRLAFHEVRLDGAMGVWSDGQRIVVGTRHQIIRLENILAAGQKLDGADRHFIPRLTFTTGDVDIHELSVDGEGQIVFVNTRFSCLSVPSPVHSFRPVWKPPFISRLAAEDRCHLNGLAMKDGRAAYVTATSRSDVVNGWRDRRGEGGCVIDVASNALVTEKLSMPHSPRWHDGRLWVLNSGSGHLGTVDLARGEFEPAVFCPGFLRGLAFHREHAIVALSLPRDGAFRGLALDEELNRRDADPWCGIQVVDLKTGDIVQWIRLREAATELFDVCVLPGVRLPKATAPSSEDIGRIISIDAS